MMEETFEVHGETYTRGQEVTGVVVWPDGHTTVTTGTLRFVREGMAYVDTAVGIVEMDAETLESA